MTLLDGEYLKEVGMRVAEKNNQEYVDTLREIGRMIATEKGTVCIDDVRAVADVMGIKPKHPNCHGSVFNRDFREVGMIKSRRPSNHARRIGNYKLEAVA